MTKKGVRIVYGVQMVERGVKIGKVGLLPSGSRTWVKTHARKQDPAYADPFPRTQSLKNILAYVRIELRT